MVAPPVPGVGERIFGVDPQREFWYQPFHQLGLAVTVLWPEHDPLFPRAWSDRLDSFFADVDLRDLDGAGHFVPLEAPEAFAAAILERCR